MSVVVAKVLVFDAADNLLVLRRSGGHPHLAYHLDFPGGIVDDLESQEAAAARELSEETGLEVAPRHLRLLAEDSLLNYFKVYLYEANLSEVRPDVGISWEHDQYEWLTPAELLDRPASTKPDPIFDHARRHLARHANTKIRV